MCGVVAIRSFRAPVSDAGLWASTRCLTHRGPDGLGVWISPDRAVGLGHTRLAIVDVGGGSQPIANEDGQIQIVVNGEFYGFEAVRRSLVEAGHRFRTGSDSEIAVHLYEDLGVKCVERLRGQFAFVLWDERTRTLFAARDRFGLKPLFYHESNGVIILASEAKALFEAGVRPEWDEDGVYHTLHACPDERRSLFKGIAQLPPGHVLISTPGGMRIERYWDLPPPDETAAFATVDRTVPEIAELIGESVHLRLRADVPVGFLLSGGLDSSAVLGLAGPASDRRAFTVAFDQADDEGILAADTAREVGVRFERVHASDRAIADAFGDAVRHAETVQYNAHGTARFLLSRGIHDQGYKTVLAGEGADEAFFGYEFLRRAAAIGNERRLRFGTAWKLLRHAFGPPSALRDASPWLARILALMNGSPAGSPALLDRLSGGVGLLRSVLSADYLERFSGFDVYREYYRICDARARISTWHPARQVLYLWLHSPFVNYHLAADRLDMAHGVEVRLPFLDHILFEHVQKIPVATLTRGKREKTLLREAVRDHIPEHVYRREKRPFWAPASAAQAGTPMNRLVQDILRSDAMADVPFLDRARVVRLMDEVSTRTGGDGVLDSVLILLTSVAVLEKAYRP